MSETQVPPPIVETETIHIKPVRIENYTPHDVNIVDENGNVVITIPRSGKIARVKQERRHVGFINIEGKQVPIVKTVYGEVEGLPEKPEEDKLYIVSTIVAQALSNKPEWKNHLLVPDTGPGSVVRDKDGKIVGVRFLILY